MLEMHNGLLGTHSKTIIENAGLAIEPGKIKGLVAPNGYGKTTLMRVLSGDFAKLKKGYVSLDGKACSNSFQSESILYVPGDASQLYGHLTVHDHFEMVAKLWGTQNSIDEVMDAWDVRDFSAKLVRNLSSGMKQQVSLGLAELCSPRYLLLDEPTNALDPINARKARYTFLALKNQGVGMLVSSHLLGTIEEICDSVIFFSSDGLVEIENSNRISEDFEKFYGKG